MEMCDLGHNARRNEQVGQGGMGSNEELMLFQAGHHFTETHTGPEPLELSPDKLYRNPCLRAGHHRRKQKNDLPPSPCSFSVFLEEECAPSAAAAGMAPRLSAEVVGAASDLADGAGLHGMGRVSGNWRKGWHVGILLVEGKREDESFQRHSSRHRKRCCILHFIH